MLSTQRPLAAGSGQTRWSNVEGGLLLGEQEKSQVQIRVESTSTEIFDSAESANPACILPSKYATMQILRTRIASNGKKPLPGFLFPPALSTRWWEEFLSFGLTLPLWVSESCAQYIVAKLDELRVEKCGSWLELLSCLDESASGGVVGAGIGILIRSYESVI